MPGPASRQMLELVMVAYNEAECIEGVIRSFYSHLSRDYEVAIIVAEDGSTDGTRNILRALSQELPIKLVLAEQRRGYGGAIRDALMQARSDTILFADSDGQYAPEDFDELLKASNEQDMVIGKKIRRLDAPHRNLMSYCFHSIVRLIFHIPVSDPDCGYRIFRRDVAHSVAPKCRLLPYSFWTEFTVRSVDSAAGFRVTERPIGHRQRLSGNSRIYRIMELPSIVLSQIMGLFALWRELRAPTSTAQSRRGAM